MDKEVRLGYDEHQKMLETIDKQDKIIGQLLQDKEDELIFIDYNSFYDKKAAYGNEKYISIPHIMGENETAQMLDEVFRKIKWRLEDAIRDRNSSTDWAVREREKADLNISKLIGLMRQHCNRRTFKKITGYEK